MLYERTGADYRGGNAPLQAGRGIDKMGGIMKMYKKSIDKISGMGRVSSIILYL